MNENAAYLEFFIGSTTTSTNVRFKFTTIASLPYFEEAINPVSFWNAFGSPVATNAVIYLCISNAVVTFVTGSFVVPLASQNIYGISPLWCPGGTENM
jgi:hypothetical protein